MKKKLVLMLLAITCTQCNRHVKKHARYTTEMVYGEPIITNKAQGCRSCDSLFYEFSSLAPCQRVPFLVKAVNDGIYNFCANRMITVMEEKTGIRSSQIIYNGEFTYAEYKDFEEDARKWKKSFVMISSKSFSAEVSV